MSRQEYIDNFERLLLKTDGHIIDDILNKYTRPYKGMSVKQLFDKWEKEHKVLQELNRRK